MNKFFICGNKIENVTRALVVAILLQFYKFLTFTCQAEFDTKQSHRESFQKRQLADRREVQKERIRALKSNSSKKGKSRKKKTTFIQQGLFTDCCKMHNDYVYRSVTALFADVDRQVKATFADPEVVSLVSTRLASAFSVLHLLKNETRPSKIIAIITLAFTSILPEVANRTVTGTLSFSASQIAYFKERFGFNPFSQQSVFDDSDTKIHWISKLPEYISNWEAAKQSPAFSKISELISILATMGFIDGEKLCVSVRGMELFRLGTVRKHADAADLVSAVLSSLEFFLSGGYEFFLTGSPRRFLFDDRDSKDFDELYEMLLEATPHAKSMNLPIMKVEFKGEKILMDDEVYLQHLENAISLCKKCKQISKSNWQVTYFQTRLDRMIGWRADYNARRSNGRFRQQPLSIWIYGKSGVGKSTLSPLLIKALLRYMGVPEDELDRIASINEQDKYDSTITGGVHAYLTDDVMNTKPEYLESAPTQKIIDHNNNAPLFANKAEIEGKGVTPHKPKITCYTSNCRIEQVANQYSICSESIQRRMIINIDARVKPEFCLPNETRMDSKKVFDTFGFDPMPDIWDIVISEASSQSNTGMIELGPNFEPTTAAGHLFNICEVLEYCYRKADSHLENQLNLQNIQENIVEKLQLCKICRRVGKLCKCDGRSSEETNAPFNQQALFFNSTQPEILDNSSILDFDGFRSSFNDLIVWLDFIPAILVNFGDFLIAKFAFCPFARRVYWFIWSHMLPTFLKNVLLFCGCVDLILNFILYFLVPSDLFLIVFIALQFVVCLFAIYFITQWYRDRLCLLDRLKGAAQFTYNEIKRCNWKYAAKWLTFGVIACQALRMLQSTIKMRNIVKDVTQQSVLDPETHDEVKERDGKVSDWAKPAFEELHVVHEARTTTFEQLRSKVKKNLYHVTFIAEDGSTNRCDGLVIEGNCMLLPLHVFGNKTKLKVMCRLKEGDGLNSVFKGFVSLNMASTIEGVDLAYVSATFLNPHSSLVKYFPEKISHSRGAGAFIYRDFEGKIRDDLVGFKTSQNHSGGSGFVYSLPYTTFNGLCMGVLVAEYNVPCIAGVHLMGCPDTSVGLSLIVTQEMITKLIDGFSSRPCLNAVSNGTFPTQLYGIDIVNQSEIHPNSPLNYLPKYSRITAVGNCPGRSSHTKSTVHKTIISDLVEEVCGVPCIWGAPKFNSKRQWQASMQYSANTSCGLDPELLEWAMRDYTEDLVAAFSRPQHKDWIKAEFKPLDTMEILAGRDGVRFLDAIPKNTSKGFPLSGPKEEWLVRLDPDAFEAFQCPVSMRQEVWDRAEEMCECFRRGERAYAVFKACVKDEPTPLVKDKVRIFQAADWAFQLLVRKYFLPLARLMSVFPLHSECAVGINAHGPEWDEYAKHITKYGKDRILAGDYGKFDLRMPAQMLMASYKILCDVCKICGTYSDDDLCIMRGIATEISYSVVAYNGDMIIHNGSHPSGNNMTVYANCVDNCLNFRCGFAYNGLKNGYTLKTLPKFKSVCALGTYGDDAKGSVKKGFDWFNHITFADYLAANDIVFTMPDKESDPVPFMKDDEADFLKRHNVFNPETGLIHGALDEDSIFKSLHTVLKSSIGAKQHAAGNVEGALREWFHHGREVFNLRHKQMIEIAERAQLQHLSADANLDTGVVMNSLYDDYDVRLAIFKRKAGLE